MRAIVGLVLLFTACAQTEAELQAKREACDFAPGAVEKSNIPIDTFVILVLENRSFDHLLGGLRASYPEVDLAPDDAMNPDASGAPVARHHLEVRCITDTEHEWMGAHAEWNEGKNDGFVKANAGAADDPSGSRAMGYYDARELPTLHALAGAYATSDRHFSSLLGPTLPNRMFLFAGTSFGVSRGRIIGDRQPNLFDAMDAAGVDWAEYHEDLISSSILLETFLRHYETPHYPGLDQFFADAAGGTLKPVSFVEGKLAVDDGHPPGHVMLTDQLIRRVVEAVSQGPQWGRAAILISFDENGGLYDHVPPPSACVPDDHPADEGGWGFDRYGFRVPLVVVSPWAKRHQLGHRVTDHTSILRLIEGRFGLPAFTRRDANADPLSELFDFASAPRMTPAPLPPLVIDAADVQDCQTRHPASEASGP